MKLKRKKTMDKETDNINKEQNQQNKQIKEETVAKEQQETAKEEKQKETKQETPEEKIESLGNKLAEMNDKYLRLYSEFENYRKRTTKEKIDTIRFASEETIKDLLPVVDDYERAIQDINNQKNIPEKTREGLLLVFNKLTNFLSQKGVKPIEAKGAKFDASLHEASAQFPAKNEEEKGIVIDEITKGYTMYDKVIRFSKVVVAI